MSAISFVQMPPEGQPVEIFLRINAGGKFTAAIGAENEDARAEAELSVSNGGFRLRPK